MATFLLELRTEEIPANALPGAREQLVLAFRSGLVTAGYGERLPITAWSTSRRLAVVVEGLPATQPDRSERVTGPPCAVAFSADGDPTGAAKGFARKVGLPVEELEQVETAKGLYLAATVLDRGRETDEVLAGLVPGLVKGLHFPKTMRWGLGEHLFVRPVHGVVALLDAEVVPFELFGVEAGRVTVGHRVEAPDPFELDHAASYAEALRRRGVEIDPVERRATLERLAAELAGEVDCVVHSDPGLVAEHVELVEGPGLVRGEIDGRFLELPPEVVVTTLRHHQKCLVLERADGSLAPAFLAVVDRADDADGLIRQGNEWVVGARLADARFFFDEDRKRSLGDLAAGLDRLEYHRTLGSMGAKAARCGELAVALASALDLGLAEAEVRRTATLAKADLLSHMVGEFPELQGVVGGHYLRLDGAPVEVWTAVRDHYRPNGFDGDLPESELGRLLAAADRLDTVVGLFAVGERPTGSKDPFALRRAAQGLVRIIAESGWELDLRGAIEAAVGGVASVVECDHSAVASEVEAFLGDRVRRYLGDRVGVAFDTAEAVMVADWHRLPSLVARARALEAVRAKPELRELALAFKRVRNIVDGEPEATVDPSLFTEPEERELYEAGEGFHAEVGRCLGERRFDAAFEAMGPIAEVLDRFFVEVLVMADDGAIRANRIALLRSLGRDFLALADLSRLQVEGGER